MSEPASNSFFHTVQNSILECLEVLGEEIPGPMSLKELGTGKMLRSTLIQRLAEQNIAEFDHTVAKLACTATELVHTASLCHDDIIDNATLRRGSPTVWKKAGVPGALLIGDLLLVESFRVIGKAQLPGMVTDFADKLKTLCAAEMNQELYRGTLADEQRWRSICSGKTGTLFAFPARWSCWKDEELSKGLETSGMLLGCAYQMFDDILDIFGCESYSGKSLGTDEHRNKLTIPGPVSEQRKFVCSALRNTLDDAYNTLAAWPQARQAITMYIQQDMLPVFQKIVPELSWPNPSLHQSTAIFKV